MTRKAEEELKTPFSYFGYEPESEEEKRFLNDYNPEKWKKASHTADVAVFALSEAGLERLLVLVHQAVRPREDGVIVRIHALRVL